MTRILGMVKGSHGVAAGSIVRASDDMAAKLKSEGDVCDLTLKPLNQCYWGPREPARMLPLRWESCPACAGRSRMRACPVCNGTTRIPYL